MPDDDQSSLIISLQRHERYAWGVVVDRHLQEVYGFVFHLVGGDRSVAEEVNQEVWLEALRGIGRCDPTRGSFRNWLLGIARRRVAFHYRCRAAGSPSPFNVPLEEMGDPGDGFVLPQDAVEHLETISVVRAAMLVVPDDRRKALLWKYAEGLSVETIAIRMGKTVKAVESLLSRARGQLRELLRGYVMRCGDGRPAAKESSHD